MKERYAGQIMAGMDDFDAFPEKVQNAIMRVLTIVAEGRKADIAKPLKGFGSGIFEVALRYRHPRVAAEEVPMRS